MRGHFRIVAAAVLRPTGGKAPSLPRMKHAPPANEPMRPAFRGRGSGPSTRRELYEYYKNMGMLEVYFSLFPCP